MKMRLKNIKKVCKAGIKSKRNSEIRAVKNKIEKI